MHIMASNIGGRKPRLSALRLEGKITLHVKVIARPRCILFFVTQFFLSDLRPDKKIM